MIIQNDVVTFEPSDIAQFSPELHAALVKYVGERLTPEVFLSDTINRVLADASAVQLKAAFGELEPLFINADKPMRDEARVLLDQIKVVLTKVEEPAPGEPAPVAPAASPSLLNKIVTFFTG